MFRLLVEVADYMLVEFSVLIISVLTFTTSIALL